MAVALLTLEPEKFIKGHVSLGSLRIRQDYMIAQALSQQPFASARSNKP